MKKYLVIGIVILMGVFLLVGCGESKKSKKDEIIVLKENKSVCDDILVESEEQDDYSRLYYYDYESESQVYACSQANCNHDIGDFKSDKINCNAIIEGKAKYTFIYNRRLYYFVGVGDTYTLWSSKTDGTDKKEVNELEFPIYVGGEYVLHGDKLFVASYKPVMTEYGTNREEQTGADAEVYQINLSNGKVEKLTDFGNKADAYCSSVQLFDNKLFIRYDSREKTYKDAGFKDVDHFMVWMESDKFSYGEEIKRLQEKKEYYTYDLENKKTEKLDIGFESNFKPYKGIKNMDGAYWLLCYSNDTVYYLDAVVGKYNIYSYNIKTKKRKEIFGSFKNVDLYYDGKIYITSMDMNEKTKKELVPSVDFNKEPKYYIYDVSKDKMTRQSYGEKGKIFYAIDLNPKGLLMYDISFNEAYDSIDEHSITQISNNKIIK